MLSTAIYSVPWPDIIPLMGIIIVSPLLFFYLFPLDAWYRTFAAWKPFDAQKSHALNDYIHNSQKIVTDGLARANVFRMISDNGYKTVLSPKFANEISRLPTLSFSKIFEVEFHSHIAGFSPFEQFAKDSNIFQDAVRTKLTQALGSVIKPLAEETTISLRDRWTEDAEWHDIALRPSILQIVAQLSSRIFLGDQICRNPDWLRVTVDYTVHSVGAANQLRLWPEIIRPTVARFLRSTRQLRQDLREAEKIIKPVLEERRKSKETASKTGKPLPHYNDAMEWMEQVAKGRSYEPAAMQLTFSFVATHTTTDMLTQAIFDLCERQEFVEELRKEVISVIPSEGWKKTAMYKLQLMDSFLKESQRMKPISNVSMRRIVGKDLQLSDGTKIPKDTSLLVAGDWMWDSEFYENPLSFDPYRFLKMRQTPGRENHAQLVSSSPEHMGFGFGNHACPGRFFASNEIKIFLCHMLLKYDFKLAEGSDPRPQRYGFQWNANPQAKISIRRRREEIVLEDFL